LISLSDKQQRYIQRPEISDKNIFYGLRILHDISKQKEVTDFQVSYDDELPTVSRNFRTAITLVSATTLLTDMKYAWE
jgi:hypothetical protein